jgi:hypothetical protein
VDYDNLLHFTYKENIKANERPLAGSVTKYKVEQAHPNVKNETRDHCMSVEVRGLILLVHAKYINALAVTILHLFEPTEPT